MQWESSRSWAAGQSPLSSSTVCLAVCEAPFLSYLSRLVLLSFLLLLLFSLLSFSAGSAFISSSSPLFPSAPQAAALPVSPIFFFFPLASSSLPNLVPCFVSAEQLGFFPLLELCSTAKDYKVSQVKAAHEHMKVQRLSWRRFRFAGCLPVLLLYIILLSPSAVMETVCGSCCGAQLIFLGSCK